MSSAILHDILGPQGAIARRMGERYEFRPQQLEMASAVEQALTDGGHLLVEAGTGVGKSFAYLLPAIEFVVKHKKRVVISTHTISLQEQLIHKDIPLLQSLYPDEFLAVLVKGRNNYLCQRRLDQARRRSETMFDFERQRESLWQIEDWAAKTTDGSLADLPAVPEPGVWDKVCAEHGNCLGKRCPYYDKCFWQAAKRRMMGGKILVVNHALFFSDLALRMAGVQYLPRYDAVILDEAHTVEDVASQHFGLKVTEPALMYQLRTLYDPKRGKGLLSVHGSLANDAISDAMELHELAAGFFERCAAYQEQAGRNNGRLREANFVENDVTPRMQDLAKHLKVMLSGIEKDEERSELTAAAEKVHVMGETLSAIVEQKVEGAVYWMDVGRSGGGGGAAGKGPMGHTGQQRVSLHAAPISVAEGLRRELFTKLVGAPAGGSNGGSGGRNDAEDGEEKETEEFGVRGAPPRRMAVIMASATLCTAGKQKSASASPREGLAGVGPAGQIVYEPPDRIMGILPMRAAPGEEILRIRQGTFLPHWTSAKAIYAVTFRLADSLPAPVLEAWKADRQAIVENAKRQNRPLTTEESKQLEKLHSDKVDKYLDAGHGECWLRRDDVAQVVADALRHFEGVKYKLWAWCVMPNHVHVVVEPINGNDLAGLLHSWKSFTANTANRLLGRSGPFWRTEYHDHLVRDEKDFLHSIEYAWLNPEKSGWKEWKWRWMSDGTESTSQGHPHVQDAHDTTSPPTRTARGIGIPKPGPDPFAYIKSRLGVDDAATLMLGSPFDFETQATLYIETALPPPNDAAFLPLACEKIIHYLEQTRGGAFVLFTSYKMLIEAANRLKPEIDALGLPMFVQGQGAPARVLLERFRATADAVLFGTSSFWQGIDVQGDQLRNVIIVKLPFAVPDEPVTEARLDAIRREGGNPFMDYSLPEAIIKLKQGFGRLIRARSDRGIVVILDSRISGKFYGRLFLDALPPCRRIEAGRPGRR